MNHRKVLMTLLGRAEKKDGGYRKTSYRFPDGSVSEPVAFLGWELRQRIRPDKIIVLGTSGSMWDWLIEPVADWDQDQCLALIDSVADQQVTQEQIQYFSGRLSESMRIQVDLHIISESQTPADQLAFLSGIAPLVEDGDQLTLDLTHGYRHLPILLLMAVVYFRSIRSIVVSGVYSSFYDQDIRQGVVFDTSGLLQLFDWHSALSAFDKDGDPGVFAELLANDGCDKNTLRNLGEASFKARIHRHEQAWTAERAVANELEKGKLSGVSGLFAPYLKGRLASKEGSDQSKRLARMARRQLELGSYDRAALLGLSAAAAELAGSTEELADVHDEILGGLRGNEKARKAYQLLNGIRNSIAHTSSLAKNHAANRALSNEDTLNAELKRIFDTLLATN